MRRFARTTVHAVSLASSLFFFVAGCGGETPPAQSPSGGSGASGDSSPSGSSASSTPAPASTNDMGAPAAPHICGEADKVHKHDLNSTGVTEAFVPCSKAGKSDYSGMIKIETLPEGVHIVIHATDDQVNNGVLGGDVKTRDAVLVYPRGRGSKSVEVPLMKTDKGYTGDKIVLWDDLDKITDDGTKLEIAVYDHDGKTGESAEEMHVQVAVSTGKSCEKAQDENPQAIEMGKASRPDLTDAQLGAPMKNTSWFGSCGLADSADANVCVAVKNGKPLGVSVSVTPDNKRVAACIDRAARKLQFPSSEKLDVVHEKY